MTNQLTRRFKATCTVGCHELYTGEILEFAIRESWRILAPFYVEQHNLQQSQAEDCCSSRGY